MDFPQGQPDNGEESFHPSSIIKRHQKGVWRYLRMLGCDAATADDLTQETFLKVLGRDDFVHHNDTATAAYLRRTAHNLMVSMVRRHRKMHLTSEVESLDDVWNRWAGADLSGDESVEALRKCLEELTERARLALRLRYTEQARRASIGETLGITDHGARNLMQRAKSQLRVCVEKRLKVSDSQSGK